MSTTFEEKPNIWDIFLFQIEVGFKLKKVKTNDRSKPMLDGLRKFRRQMTIEEQIQKSMSMASIPPVSFLPQHYIQITGSVLNINFPRE